MNTFVLLMVVCIKGQPCEPKEHLASFHHREAPTARAMCRAFVDVLKARGGMRVEVTDGSGRTATLKYECQDERMVP